MLTVGCAGFAVPATRYFRELRFVEVQETFRASPGSGTLRRWRREAGPDFRFALLAPRQVAQDGCRYGPVARAAFAELTEVVRELSADTVVVLAPPDFGAERAHRQAVVELLVAARDLVPTAVFEPGEGWFDGAAEEVEAESGALVARDPLRAGLSPGATAYYRLPGPAGRKSRYEDPSVGELAALARDAGEQHGTWVFANIDMFTDAQRFTRAVAR